MRFKFIGLAMILAVCGSVAAGQAPGMDLSNYGVRVEPDRRLIVVLSALDMAEIKTPNGDVVRALNTTLSPAGAKFRSKLAADNAALPADLRQRISAFVAQYRKQRPNATDGQIVSPFVSMAYTLAPVPDLGDPAVTSDLPGDLLDVLDFAPLAREFFRKSTISANLDEYVKLYRSESDATLRSSARTMVSDLLDYLHTRPETVFVERKKTQTLKAGSKKEMIEKIEDVTRERRFFITPEMLLPAESVVFLNVKDDYHVIVPPTKDLTSSDARRAFLQYVIDPLVFKSSKDIATIRDGVKAILDERRKKDPSVSPDIFLMTTRSLIAAVDARQEEYIKSSFALAQARRKIDAAKTDAERKAISADLDKFRRAAADETALRLSEDYERGSVLSFYFADALRGVEDSGFDIAASLREMILSFDAAKEKGRLEQNADARTRAAAARTTSGPTPAIDNPVTVRLIEISKTIEAKDLTRANADLKDLLSKNPGDARIYYNLGRVASLQAEAETDPETQAQKLLEAKAAYTNVLSNRSSTTDGALLSQTFVNLARIYAFHGENAYALKLYEEAIKLGDLPDSGYQAAISGKQRLLRP